MLAQRRPNPRIAPAGEPLQIDRSIAQSLRLMLALVVLAHRFEHHAADGQHAPAIERILQSLLDDAQFDPLVAQLAILDQRLELLVHFAAAFDRGIPTLAGRAASLRSIRLRVVPDSARRTATLPSCSSEHTGATAKAISWAKRRSVPRSRWASAWAVARRRNSASSRTPAASSRRRRALRKRLASRCSLFCLPRKPGFPRSAGRGA